jgi:hypothetical protein
MWLSKVDSISWVPQVWIARMMMWRDSGPDAKLHFEERKIIRFQNTVNKFTAPIVPVRYTHVAPKIGLILPFERSR